jgi:large subunit ribosomal protein L28e
VDFANRLYQAISKNTAQNNYRPDLRGPAVSRASAIKHSQMPKKETPEKRLRGSKAKKVGKA